MSKSLYDGFTHQFSRSKTLRFELQPQGKTQEFIEKNGILSEDEKRAEDYKVVKGLMDKYHKSFISDVLGRIYLGPLEKYQSYYRIPNKTEQEKKEMSMIETSLRKEISEAFKNDRRYKRLFGKEIVTEDLTKIAKMPEEKKAIDNFRMFTTYFQGFYENRKNMYSEEEKSTAIAYRIVNQNLPRYLDNIRTFQVLMNTELCEKIAELQERLKDELQGHRIEDYFQSDFYSQVLTNEAISLYNTIIGGVNPSEVNGTKVQGINEYVNLYNHRRTKTKEAARLPKLKMLYKQILSDRQIFSFVDTQFEDDQEVLDEIKSMVSEIKKTVLDEGADNSLKILLKNIASYDLDKIYIRNGLAITNLSNHVLGDWSAIKSSLEKQYDEVNAGKKRNENYYDKRRKYIKNKDSYSIMELNQVLESYGGCECRLEEHYASLGQKEGKDLIDLFELSWQQVQRLLNMNYSDRHDLMREKENVARIKALLDSLKEIESFVKPLLGKGNEADKDEEFYGELDLIYSELKCVIPLYNKVRNYLTRKPYSTEKIKLNFQNPTLLNGWDLNKERDNLAIILRKEGLYYLGIMQKKYNTVFLKGLPGVECDDCYEKMEYKLLPGPNKMLPKVFFAKSNVETFEPPVEILNNYKKGTHKKGEAFDIDQCHNLIDYFKDSIEKHEDWKNFGFHFTDTKDYEDISQFYHEVEKQGYSLSFRKIPADYIDSLVNDGKLYLFKIYNKDFSEHTKGRPNLHTIYWKMLFDEKNLQNVVYKLNGEAEVFFRKASIKENLVIHHKNKPIQRKNVGIDQENKESTFVYDIIKDRRYTVDKYQFHVPITMNFCAEGNSQLNMKVMDAIRNAESIHVIGIDRGERNLLYVTVVDSDGKIVHQNSLNIIKNDNGYKQDYQALLDDREKRRGEARQNWMEIENIKELKEGYLSQAIHEITNLMLKYNDAIVVLEDLNSGFKNGRKKVEKQVYQKFEQMLIDKLNYFVDKKRDPQELGGVLNAYQLTSEFNSFAKLGQQSGFLFYVPAWNTSKIDPTTGFVNLLYPKYTNQEEARKFIRQFDRIRFNKEAGYFEFDLDYSKFTDRATGSRTKWTLCSRGERIVNFRNPKKNNKWDTRIVPLTEEIKDLLVQYQISLEEEDLRETICGVEGKDIYERFIYYIRLIVQLRNSDSENDIDYIISPVMNEAGEFFDSREVPDYLPQDADANGAYNIARKGLWVVEQIQKQSGYRIKLAISNKEWLDYAQTHITL